VRPGRVVKDPSTIHTLGSQLHQSLFVGDVHDAFVSCLDKATKEGEHVIVRLSLGEKSLLEGLPWEHMFDAQPLVPQTGIIKPLPVIRYQNKLIVEPFQGIHRPLTVLLVGSNPGLFDVFRLWRNLEDQYGPEYIRLQVLYAPTANRLLETMASEAIQVVHLLGHADPALVRPPFMIGDVRLSPNEIRSAVASHRTSPVTILFDADRSESQLASVESIMRDVANVHVSAAAIGSLPQPMRSKFISGLCLGIPSGTVIENALIEANAVRPTMRLIDPLPVCYSQTAFEPSPAEPARIFFTTSATPPPAVYLNVRLKGTQTGIQLLEAGKTVTLLVSLELNRPVGSLTGDESLEAKLIQELFEQSRLEVTLICADARIKPARQELTLPPDPKKSVSFDLTPLEGVESLKIAVVLSMRGEPVYRSDFELEVVAGSAHAN
jgi:hypothetical protein